jgi:hypothetical protein
MLLSYKQVTKLLFDKFIEGKIDELKY